MNIKDAYDQIVKEYLGKLKVYGCDGCVAEVFCIDNMYKKSRNPVEECPERIKECLRKKRR